MATNLRTHIFYPVFIKTQRHFLSSTDSYFALLLLLLPPMIVYLQSEWYNSVLDPLEEAQRSNSDHYLSDAFPIAERTRYSVAKNCYHHRCYV